jgi:hypothetical protein
MQRPPLSTEEARNLLAIKERRPANGTTPGQPSGQASHQNAKKDEVTA